MNLSIRDILLAGLCVPFTLHSEIIVYDWHIGDIYCIVYRYFFVILLKLNSFYYYVFVLQICVLRVPVLLASDPPLPLLASVRRELQVELCR